MRSRSWIEGLMHGKDKYPELEIPSEMHDFMKVLEMGARKYSANNWLEPNGKRSSFKEYHDSAFHHLANSYSGQRLDTESGLDHLLHVACNALMLYTRLKRGIKHEKDNTINKEKNI